MKIKFKATFNCTADFPGIEDGDILKIEEAKLSIKNDFALRLEFENKADLHQLRTFENDFLPEITNIVAKAKTICFNCLHYTHCFKRNKNKRICKLYE